MYYILHGRVFLDKYDVFIIGNFGRLKVKNRKHKEYVKNL